jgi:hypothetical protein
MRNVVVRGLRVLLPVGGFIAVVAVVGLRSHVVVQGQGGGLPDLAPMGMQNLAVTQRLGGPTLEFNILTANIGGQDFDRPRDPGTGQLLLPQIYEYALYNRQFGNGHWAWVEVDRRRKNTICTIDDHVVFGCLSEHGATHFCGSNQGISKGWVDDYFRGLTGQWVFVGDNTGRFMLEAILDPDGDLQRTDIPDAGRDGDPTNNFDDVFFTWDGSTLGSIQELLSFDPGSICPMAPKR